MKILTCCFYLLVIPLALFAEDVPENLTPKAKATAGTRKDSDPYGAPKLADGDLKTRWASEHNPKLPYAITLDWTEEQNADLVVVDIFSSAKDYAVWKSFEITLSDGTTLKKDLKPGDDPKQFIRFDAPHRITSLTLRILEVQKPELYVGVSEIGVYLDPRHYVKMPSEIKSIAKPKNRVEIPVGAPRQHPCVYVNSEDLKRAKRNSETTEWGREAREKIIRLARPWLENDETFWLQFLPEPGACYAYGQTGCPVCGGSMGAWEGANCHWKNPGKIKCSKCDIVFPNETFRDDGTGYKAKDGRIHYLTGIWNAWVTEQWCNAIPNLAVAFILTGEDKYAQRAAFFLDALASIYAESTAGSWDYPSSPPSGRLARPWYQVARVLHRLARVYDLIYKNPALDAPSIRPTLEKKFSPGPRAQQRAVGRADACGTTRPSMTKRENIDINLMQDGAYYCYSHTFENALGNGYADYMRGALAVGALLNIPEYVYHSILSPTSIYSMTDNNGDRDGEYFETTLGYSRHTRELYLTFAEPLRYWRDGKYPNGINLYDHPKFRNFYIFPDLRFKIAGHIPNFGDVGPDSSFIIPEKIPYSNSDYLFAEHLYFGASGEAKNDFARILSYLSQGNVEKQRKSATAGEWLLFHADPVDCAKPANLSGDLDRKLNRSWFMGQKGIGILRDGDLKNAQGALLRYGPSLVHGQLDDLGLLYYAKGWQLTYNIGYGFGGAHTRTGWAHQTASHTLVTVNEKSQGGKNSGSGGSLYLFCETPALKLMEADSPLSYKDQDVEEYRRTAALIGEGKDQVLLDIFRVKGGSQHDYIIGTQPQNVSISGVKLAPEEGSLAGKEYAWGEKILKDGDISGYPNRPYWNAPPGNGYGFFYGIQRGVLGASPVQVDWELGGPIKTHFRLHPLCQDPMEIILAKGPGFLPQNKKAGYMILRNKGEKNLKSAFVTLMEPYSISAKTEEGFSAFQLVEKLAETNVETKMLESASCLLVKGTKPGDFAGFDLEIAATGNYRVKACFYKAASYGTVALSIDGKPFEKHFAAGEGTINEHAYVDFGAVQLSTGKHRLRFELTAEANQYYAGISKVAFLPEDKKETLNPAEPKPIVAKAERVAVTGKSEVEPVGVRFERNGLDEYFFSAGLKGEKLSAKTAGGIMSWEGAALYAAFRGKKLESLAAHGVKNIALNDKPLVKGMGVVEGKVVKINAEEHWVETDVPLPKDLPEGAMAAFSNPRYSRNTAYRIYGTSGSRLLLGEQALTLGRGRVLQILGPKTLSIDIPHEYCRSKLNPPNSRFFDGKRITGANGGKTVIRSFKYDGKNPSVLEVDDSNALQEGEEFYYDDLQPGDRIVIPLTVKQTF
ncbi:MAG: heparinase II/III family protein [Verrucomicrobiae bacterium]|nr:heparinase II/III family protein [Verrucomicrobiae bacterium]